MQIADDARPALAALDLRHELSTLRRDLHRYPELGFEEHATAERLRSWLGERGLEPSAPLAGTGFVVEVEGERPGPTVAYRADMDALPIHEATDAPYRSCAPGVMHACGHDGHMAIACGVALLASRRRD